MSRPQRSGLGLAILVLLGRVAGAADSAGSPLELLHWEHAALLLHEHAPPEIRARIIAAFQRQVLKTAVSETDGREVAAMYASLCRGLHLEDLVRGQSLAASGSADQTLALLHSDTRKHLRLATAEDAVNMLLARGARTQPGRDDFRQTLAALRAAGAGVVDPYMAHKARNDLIWLLGQWVASWSPDTASELDGDLAVVEEIAADIFGPNRAEAASAMAASLTAFVSRTVECAAQSTASSCARRRLTEGLNPALDRLRASPLAGATLDLERFVARSLRSAPRFVAADDLRMDFALNARDLHPAPVTRFDGAVLTAIDLLEAAEAAGGMNPRHDAAIRIDSQRGDFRPFYLPAGALRLEYELLVESAASQPGVTPQTWRARVLVAADRRAADRHGAALAPMAPVLPRAGVAGHVWVSDESLGGRGFWVIERPWSIDEALERAADFLEREPFAPPGQAASCRFDALRSLANLPALAATEKNILRRPWRRAAASLDGGGSSTLLFATAPDARQRAALRDIFAAGGLLRPGAGEELPDAELAKLLGRSGTLYGLDLRGALELLDSSLRFHTLESPDGLSAHGPTAVGVSTVIQLTDRRDSR